MLAIQIFVGSHHFGNDEGSPEPSGDTAHAESYVLMVLRHKDGAMVTVAGGRYIDRLERRGGEWRKEQGEANKEARFHGGGGGIHWRSKAPCS